MEPGIDQILASGLRLLPEAVLAIDTGPEPERIIFVNQAFEQLSGYSVEELKRGGIALLRGPETDHGFFQRLLNPPFEDPQPLEILFYRKDGTPFWDQVRMTRIARENRSFWVQVHSDVSLHKENEKGLILAQKRELTSALVGVVAHDFNNLLTAILVYTGLMAPKVKDDAKLQHYVEQVHHSAERGGQLVAQLLNLGRTEAIGPEPVDLQTLVEQNSELIQCVLGADISLKVLIGPDLRKIKAHPGKIQQILLNLALNARDAMPGGGELIIRLANEESPGPEMAQPSPFRNYVELVVCDTGTGMDMGTQKNIFKPFFTTKAKGKGTGLGLFAVRTIVEQYQGKIHVESEQGKGTSFKLLLPAA